MVLGIIQMVGSLVILTAFILSQTGLLGTKSVSYLLANALGSGVLAVDAAIQLQWGFLLLEGVWALVSIAGLVRWAGARKGEQKTA